MAYDDEEMPQAPTELPPGWKPGDMLPPEKNGGHNAQDWESIYRDAESRVYDQERLAGGLLARAGLSEPEIGSREGPENKSEYGDLGREVYFGHEGWGDPQSPEEEVDGGEQSSED